MGGVLSPLTQLKLKYLFTLKLWGEGGSGLPKFKFSIEFPIGLHVILQLQIKIF